MSTCPLGTDIPRNRTETTYWKDLTTSPPRDSLWLKYKTCVLPTDLSALINIKQL